MITKKNLDTGYANVKGRKKQVFALAVSALVVAAAAILSGSLGPIKEYNESHNAYATNMPDFNFGAAGDWGDDIETGNTAKNMANNGVELALGLGDYAYDTGADEVYEWWDNYMVPLQGKFKGSLGNHDVGDQATYAELFQQTSGKWYFSFNYQNVHFVAIDSATGKYGVGSAQYNFIKNDLANAASDPNIKWIVVFLHYPFYTSPGSYGGTTDLRDAYGPLFDKYNVDLVLTAHNHNYERSYPLSYNPSSPSTPIITDSEKNNYSDPEGPIYVTAGAGGRSLYSLDGKAPFMAAQDYETFGYLDVSITNDGNTLKGAFYSNKDGTIKDSFTIDKSNATAPTPISTPEYNYDPSLGLDGSEYRDVQSNGALQIKRFSIAAWLKAPSEQQQDPKRAFIVNKGGLGSENAGKNLNYGIWMTSSGTIAGGFESKYGNDYFASSPKYHHYNDGKWHYAVLTYGGSYVKLYVDGQLVGKKETGAATPDDTGTQPLRIGANGLLKNNYFTGSVDEVRVWSRVLEPEEVLNAYRNGIFNTTGQVIYIPFDSEEQQQEPLQLTFSRDPTTPLMLGHTEPDVIKVGDTFYMYYRSDSPDGASIKVMSSTDGLSWTEQGTVLTKSASGWDSAEVIAPSMLFDGNDTYYLYYEADDASNVGRRAIGVATSSSPTGPFTKYSGNPILSPSEDWEGTIVGTPVIMKAGTTYYLFYHGYKNGSDRIGVAYSSSLLGPWEKEPNNPILDVGSSGSWDDSKVAPSSVYLDGSNVLVFYEGFNGVDESTQTSWRIGIADGTINDSDGRIKSLTRRGPAILQLGRSGSWDDNTVQLPSVIQVGNEMWMYYSGQDGTAFRLGRAIASIT